MRIVHSILLLCSSAVFADGYFTAPYENAHVENQLFDSDFFIHESEVEMSAYQFASTFETRKIYSKNYFLNESKNKIAYVEETEDGHVRLQWPREWHYELERISLATLSLGGSTGEKYPDEYVVVKVVAGKAHINKKISIYPDRLNLDNYPPLRTPADLYYFDRLSEMEMQVGVFYEIYNAAALDVSCGQGFTGVVSWPPAVTNSSCISAATPAPLYRLTVGSRNDFAGAILPQISTFIMR